MPTPRFLRKHFLLALVGLTTMSGMATNAPAQCQLQKLLAIDGTGGDFFGSSVALSGDTAVIGARYDDVTVNDSGSAYVFERVDGVWMQTAKLSAADAASWDEFGGSVAVSGDTAVIGAQDGDGLEVDSGSAYVFERVAGVWTQTAELHGDGAEAFDEFGGSVSLWGNTAVIGTRYDDTLGAAYVFEKVDGVWMQTAKLSAADAASWDEFGGSVAVSGDTAVIGAQRDDDGGSGSGSAYVFEKVAGVWTQTAKLNAADGASGDRFGNSVSLSGDTAVIGAWLDNVTLGAAYVFEKVAGVWTQTAKLNAADGASGDEFGGSVAVSGDTAVIGTSGDDAGGGNSGSAYLFEKVDGAWLYAGKLRADDEASLDEFGGSVALSGVTALIGVFGDDDQGASSGSAYLFLLGGDDCNNNSIPDACDITSGTSTDCNDNGNPDECDVDPGDPDGNGLVSLDCNTNEIPDECDLVSPVDFVHQSGEFSPFQYFADATEVIPAPPPAVGDVTLRVDVNADLGNVSEFVDVFLNGVPVGRLFDSDGAECPATFDTGLLTIPEATFNELLPGDVTVELVPSAEVGSCVGVVKLRLSYTGGSNDCDGNGVPDDCDNDSDGDGVIDDCDSCPLDNPDDTDGDGVCDADDLCSDTPLGLLVDLDGCTLMVGPCCFPGGACIDETDQQTCEAFPDGVFFGEGLTCGDPDGDGVFGCDDGCPLDPAKAGPGVCGCGVADDDGDLDGVADCIDHCLQTPPDVPVNGCGCTEVGACCAAGGGCFDDIERSLCVVIEGIYQGDGSSCVESCALGDLDGNGAVDLADFAVFERCFTGVAGEAAPACSQADIDGCGAIDLEDYAGFRAAFFGPQ